ncbi:MAG: helix-turn-helix transcriptional regulator [Prevotella sp.]|uniref:response regulator transcription factor n=1 Tax=Prevotella sp. TaxID=59823 RepID=UPI002A2F1F70|nr:helix-turn-helix transcriptional regulator [Prevotella sp.]MDD7318710.1 helix-turn-helix transcriptional regulator [Prevotellaceae bacterium]MDY4019333.1 helix-turn-helix transcriptional regulator [Prevotella sp.]
MSLIINGDSQLHMPHYARPKIEEEQYGELQPYIDSAKAYARITYQSLYIIDYYKMNFLYVSDNPLFLCGESAEKVQQEGYNFYYRHVPEEDLVFLEQVNRAGFDFINGVAISERSQYNISYNFRISNQGTRDEILINHQLTPLKLDKVGNIWLALCLVSLASTQETGVAYITSVNSNKMWQFSMNGRCWKQIDGIVLNEHEKAVISLANRGLPVGEIAKEICRSEDSVKGYRKKLFQKLGVGNISEAIAVATLRRLI